MCWASCLWCVAVTMALSPQSAKSSSPTIVTDVDTEWGRASSFRKQTPTFESKTHEDDTEEEIVEVAIVGGGLSGLASAIGLHGSGIKTRVYERAPRLRSVSQGMLALQPNGLRALEQIHADLPDLAAKAGAELCQSYSTSADGTTQTMNKRMGEDSKDKFGLAPVLIQWHELQKVLASLLPYDRVVTDRSLCSFVEEDDSVRLQFEKGQSVRCKCVLACDGTFSAVRRQILPQEDGPVFFGQLNWNAIVPTSSLPIGLHPPNTVRVVVHNGEPRWSAFLNDCGGGKTFWQLRVTDPSKALALSGSGGRGGLGLAGVKDALLEILQSSEDMMAAVTHTPEEQVFERCIVGRLPARTWRSAGGRVALVGDSAHGQHPNVGQGGNSAFESAAAVVEALVACRGDWKAGLKEYERIRKTRADVVQQYANYVGCVSTGSVQPLPAEAARQMNDWIKEGDPQNLPPKAVVDILEAFDPRSLASVSTM